MKKKLVILLGAAFLLAVVPFVAGAKDKASGKKIKIKNAKIINMDQRYITVKRKGEVYKLDLAAINPDKFEILSKYGVQVLPEELKLGDRMTFKGRDFGNSYVVPSHTYLEKGSNSKAYKKKKGKMVVTFYGYLSDDLIAGAHSLNKVDTTTIDKKGARITYKGDRKRTLKTYWTLLVKGTWSKTLDRFHHVKYVKILKKHKNEKPYSFGSM